MSSPVFSHSVYCKIARILRETTRVVKFCLTSRLTCTRSSNRQ